MKYEVNLKNFGGWAISLQVLATQIIEIFNDMGLTNNE